VGRRGAVVCRRGVMDGCPSVGRTAAMSTPAAAMSTPAAAMSDAAAVMSAPAVASTVTSFGLGESGRQQQHGQHKSRMVDRPHQC